MHAEKNDHGKCKPTLRERLMSHLVQTVPDDIALCEFNCSQTDCSHTEWKNCKRRLDPLNDDRRGLIPPHPAF